MPSFWSLRICYRLRSALVPTVLALNPSLHGKKAEYNSLSHTNHHQLHASDPFHLRPACVQTIFSLSSNSSLSSLTALPGLFQEHDRQHPASSTFLNHLNWTYCILSNIYVTLRVTCYILGTQLLLEEKWHGQRSV